MPNDKEFAEAERLAEIVTALLERALVLTLVPFQERIARLEREMDVLLASHEHQAEERTSCMH